VVPCVWAAVICGIFSQSQAGQAIQNAFENEVIWKNDGTIEATCYPILAERGRVDQVFCRMPDEVIWDKLETARQIAALFRRYARGVKIMVTEMNAGKSVDALGKGVGDADFLAALAPRPLMVQAGEHDPGMLADDALACTRHIRGVYEMLGCEERFCVDRFEGGHDIHAPTAVQWFQQWL